MRYYPRTRYRTVIWPSVLLSAAWAWDSSAQNSRIDQLEAQVEQAQIAAGTVVVNIYNTNGSITPVTLTRDGNLFVGPRGEYYLSLPTEEQLLPVYGF